MRTRLGLVVAVVALLLAGMLAAAFGNPAIEALPLPQVTVSGSPMEADDRASDLAEVLPPEAVAPTSGASGGVLLAVVAAVLLLLAVGVAWWLVRGARAVRFTRIKPVVRAVPPDATGRMRAAIEEGLTELDEGDADPRRAVIACWVRLERAAAEVGIRREPGDTSTDLVARVLTDQRVSAEVLAAFAEAYREARFAPHDVDASTRDRARAALWQIRAELAAVRPVRSSGVTR